MKTSGPVQVCTGIALPLSTYQPAIYVNKYKSYPYSGLEMPLGLQEVEENTGGKVASPRYRLSIPLRKYP